MGLAEKILGTILNICEGEAGRRRLGLRKVETNWIKSIVWRQRSCYLGKLPQGQTSAKNDLLRKQFPRRKSEEN